MAMEKWHDHMVTGIHLDWKDHSEVPHTYSTSMDYTIKVREKFSKTISLGSFMEEFIQDLNHFYFL